MKHVQSFFIFSIALILMVIFHIGLPLQVSAQDNFCDQNLPSKTTDPLGYRTRGNRCEGRYVQEVGSTILNIVSLTGFVEDYDLYADEDLIVEWTLPKDTQLHLRAQSLKQKLYYRMDTVISPHTTSYQWQTGILGALDISRNILGMIGWYQDVIDEKAQDVYVPLRIRQQESTPGFQSYRIVLWPGEELTEVFISLALVKDDGSLGNFIKDEEALEYYYYPAQQGIEFEISDLETPGLYYLEISATLEEGGLEVIEYWFYHVG